MNSPVVLDIAVAVPNPLVAAVAPPEIGPPPELTSSTKLITTAKNAA